MQHHHCPLSDSVFPSTGELRRARRSATRNKTLTACDACRISRRKCGDSRPCPRCIRRRIRCTESTSFSETLIERPLWHPPSLDIQPSLTPVSVSSNMLSPPRWYTRYEAQLNLTFGMKLSSLREMFESVPQKLQSALTDLIQLSSQRVLRKASTSDGSASSDVRQGLHEEKMDISEKVWQSNNEYGFLQILMDPQTGQRSKVVMNHSDGLISWATI